MIFSTLRLRCRIQSLSMLQEKLHYNSLLKWSPNFKENIYVHKWIVLIVLMKEWGDKEKEERPEVLYFSFLLHHIEKGHPSIMWISTPMSRQSKEADTQQSLGKQERTPDSEKLFRKENVKTSSKQNDLLNLDGW